MQKLKEVVSRGSALVGAVALLVGIGTSALPSLASADALNPLTERTLLLSSSAPGYVDTDGSGNPTYAPPDSGPNGKKTGETFNFKVSTDTTSGTTVKAFTFQYCTKAAGLCTAPGDDTPGSPRNDDDSHSDLNVRLGDGAGNGVAPSEVDCTTGWPLPGGDNGVVNRDGSEGTFVVLVGGTCNSGWTMTASNLEDGPNATGKHNYITLTNSTGLAIATGTQVKVIFYGTDDNYITNPGSDAFFVKINDYGSTDYQNFRDAYPDAANDCDTDHTTYLGSSTGTDTCNQNVIDGGVTVANIMNNSIQIRTKVLETLDFSVGTHDPVTDATSVTPCMPIDDGTTGHSGGVLYFGDATAENSLSTQTAYDTYSYWRLSSNSSNGATVYYSGNTLADTEGDHVGQIYDINSGDGGTPGDNSGEYSRTGSEQFGLGLDVKYQASLDSQGDNGFVDDYTPADSRDGAGGNGSSAALLTDLTGTAFATQVASSNPDHDYFNSWHLPQLFPLVPMGTSTVNTNSGADTLTNGNLSYGLAKGSLTVGAGGARFGFSKTANTIPVPIASESNLVVNCSTGLMRYLGNIAATTPAGIYTTSINYLAAPEY